MLRYAITDRQMFHGNEQERRSALIEQAKRLARNGIDYLQFREKDLPDEQRIELAAAMRQAIADAGGSTKVLFSGPLALALVSGADGIHLTSSMLHSEIPREQINAEGKHLIVSASCHSLEEIVLARTAADLILFGPVYEKRVAGELVTQGTGLELLLEACRVAAPIPILALGGVTEANAPECLQAGAAGYASIRAFTRTFSSVTSEKPTYQHHKSHSSQDTLPGSQIEAVSEAHADQSVLDERVTEANASVRSSSARSIRELYFRLLNERTKRIWLR